MKNRTVAVTSVCAIAALLFLCMHFLFEKTGVAEAASTQRRPVVVELFTSEGCNTCPPADDLLQKLETEQPVADAEIIAIEEHVDYWNHDGWIDPFSSGEWTQRQSDYVDLTKKKDEYTPEMVVEGQDQFVGSDVHEAIADIEAAAQQPQTEVTITPGNSGKSGMADYHVTVGALTGAASGDTAEVMLAVTEDGLHSSVTAGENAGHVLYHAAVLRTLRKIGVAEASKGDVTFSEDERVKFKSDWKRRNLHVVVFVQEKKSKKILGAATAQAS